ncbi:MAG: hypothetical protein AB8C84_11805 [Oligoflexales bacterium]
MKNFIFLFYIVIISVVAAATPQQIETVVSGQTFIFQSKKFRGLEQSSLYRSLFSKRTLQDSSGKERISPKCLDGVKGVHPETFALIHRAIETDHLILKNLELSFRLFPDDVVRHLSGFAPEVLWTLLESDLKDLGLFGILHTPCGWSSERCDQQGELSRRVLRLCGVDFHFKCIGETNLVCLDRLLTQEQCAAVFQVSYAGSTIQKAVSNISGHFADAVVSRINKECAKQDISLCLHLPTQNEWRDIVSVCQNQKNILLDFCLFDEFSTWTQTPSYSTGRVICGAEWIDMLTPGVTRIGCAAQRYFDVGVRLIAHASDSCGCRK